MLKPLMPKFRPDPSARLKDIAEKQVPAKLKPTVNVHEVHYYQFQLLGDMFFGDIF